MRWFGLAVCLAVTPLAATAQTDDRDYLTAFLEDSLSGAGRTVVVTGFEGILSARATVKEITIADDQGIWLTLRGVTMDWSRSALLTGQIVVSDLSAQDIIVERMPVSEASATTAEAGTFALPELPVSLQVDRLAADHIHLGPTILGQEVDAQLQASMALAGGEGHAELSLQRTDAGPAGKLLLTASYANADQMLKIDLAAQEAANGIAATKLGIPGAPATSLTIAGAGPLSDFAAEVALSTDGVDRLSGVVTLTAATADVGGQAFGVDLSGDLAPMFLPDYATFFGNKITLVAKGTRWSDGRLDLSELALNANALSLTGQLALASDGLPRSFKLLGRIADPQGAAVLLPFKAAVDTRLTTAELDLQFDAAADEGWRASVSVQGLDRADFKADQLNLKGSGRIARVAGARQVGGNFTFLATGLEPADAMIAMALGSSVSGDASLRWREGDGSITVQKLTLAGADYGMSLAGRVAGLSDALSVTGTARVSADDLSRFAGLVGQPISGAGEISLTGGGSPLTGAFDVQAEVRGKDLRVGIAQVDAALQGNSVVSASLLRDTQGATLRSLHVSAQAFSADASGTLAKSGLNITASVTAQDVSQFGPGLRGSVTTQAQLSGVRDDFKLTLDAKAQGLAVGQAEADRLLAGQTQMALGLTFRDGALMVDKADVSNPQFSVQASGALRGEEQTVSVKGQLNNLGLLLSDFPGALSINGTLVQTPQGTQVNLSGKGPGQINATVVGTLAPNFRSGDLAINGTALAGLANPFIEPRVISGQVGFGLRLNGPLALASLSGPVTLSNGRLADPSLPFSVDGLSARADLASGRAAITGSGGISSGGQVTVKGSAGLTAPYDGDLSVDIRNALVRDPDLYETRFSGGVTVKGPLMGGATIAGRIDLAETELRVPSGDIGAAGGLPDLQHKNEPVPVRQTRARAGLVEQGGTGAAPTSSRPYLLDLRISAPSRLFVRGRGLDAELGGELRLTGSTANVVPIGSFDLIRGRLEILSRRLDLDSASLRMEGAFIPYINVVASADSDGTRVGVEIDGPANDPTVHFTSSPTLPEEEILARLLFGDNVQNLSVLQAIELGNAVRTLAGRGGEGMISKLRRNLGLDNLDLKTNQAGDSTLTVGKYLTRNIYTELSVDAKGQSEIHLNMDVSRSVTVRGTAASDGSSTLGILVEKDY